MEVSMISRWLRKHLRRGRAAENVPTAVLRPAFDPAVRPVSWWRAL